MKTTSRPNLRVLGLAACAGLAIASQSHGQIHDWIVTDGNWSNSLNWSAANVPNTTVETARLAATGSYTAFVDGSFDIDGLQLVAPGARVSINAGGAGLGVRSLFNHGVVLVNTTAANSAANFRVGGGTTVFADGTGALQLNAIAGNLDTATILWTSNSTTEILHNTATHTIAGTGNFYARAINEGLITANVPGRVLQLFSQPKTNNARMEAINGGILRISSITVTQGPLGVIDVIDGFLTTNNIGMNGGEIRNDADSVSFTGTTNLNTVKLTGVYDIPNASNLYYTGTTLDLTGTLTINPSGGTSSTGLFANGTLILPNTSQTILNANSGNIDTAIVIWNTNATTDNYIIDSGHTLRGTGSVFARVTNNGLISADVSGRSLRLSNQPKTNNARIEAVNGGNLWIPSILITQGASGIIDVTDGTLTASQLSVNGGEIRNDTDPVAFTGTTNLNGVKLTGVFEIPNGSNLYYTGTTLDLAGTLTINPSGGASSTGLFANGTLNLPNTSQTILNANSGNVDTAIVIWNTNATTDNYIINSGHTLRGTGSVFARVTNNGLISADVNGQSLRLSNQPKTNNARIEAVNGGNLWIPSILITQGSSGVIDVTDGTLTASQLSVNGGEIRNDTDPAALTGTTNLNSVKLTGAFEIPNGSNLYYTGTTLDLTGTLTINPSGGTSSTGLFANGTLNLPNTSQTILNANSGNVDTAIVIWNTNPTTDNYIIDSGHTLRGTGSVYARLTNNGLISADVNGRTLRLNSQPKINNGRIEAVNGGIIRLESIGVTQGASGEIDATDGILSTAGVSIAGGTVRIGSASPWSPTGSTTLSAITKFGPVHLPNGQTLTLAGGSLVNHGELRISNGIGNSGTTLSINGATVISGAGDVVLDATANFGTAYIIWVTNPTNDTLTIASAQALRGNGDIYARTFIDGTLSPGLTAGAIGRFGLANQRMTLNPAATLVADIDGPSAGQFDTITGGGPITIDGTLRVRFGNAYSPLPGQTFAIINGPAVTGRFSQLDLPKGWWIEYNPNSVVVSYSGCFADWDQDGDVDSDDIVLFFGDFENGEGDVDGDDDTDSDDIIEFFSRFENGC